MSAGELIKFLGAGIELAADATGPAGGSPILFLHGSGQTRESWRKAMVIAARQGYRGVAMDLRGHGDSDWSPDGRYELQLFAADLLAALEQFSVPPIVVGASLGGLAAILAAAEAPERLRALVLVDITVRVDMEGAKDVIDFMSSGLNGFTSLEEASDAVASYLPHRRRPDGTSGLARNLRLRDGRYYWHWDPAFMRMGQNAQERLNAPNQLEASVRALKIPTLLVRGGRSRIVTEAGAREFLELAPHTEYADVADAHHMVAGDANDAFNSAIFAFIGRQMHVAAAT